MDFEFSENHLMVRDLIKDFVKREVQPGAYDRDQTGNYPMEIVKKLGELGMMGIIVPEQFGGAGLDVTSFCIVIEEISKVDASLGLTLSAHNGLPLGHLLTSGSDALKSKYLPKLASGEQIGAWCLTEPVSGSDALGMNTVAEKKGTNWVINGSKNFITNATVADVFIILAFTDKGKGTRGVSAFVAERGWKGLTIGKPENKLGMRSSDTASITFENLEIPEANVVGNVGEGFIDALKVLDRGRVVIGSLALGIGKGALAEGAKYSKERTAFGKSISEFQAIQWKLADAATQLEAAEVLVYRAAWMHDQKTFAKLESSMAKLFASEAAWSACNQALQIHGGYGYVKEYPVERFFRDVKLCEIGEGTSEIQREVISSLLVA
ncbi:MAG: acyl-CoA dehydrogenase family protein [Bdellovibrionales bacterium]|nr:acyl-CoA dehydrogenase family protein [Bdellovibrionales bacterium]